MVMGYHLQSLFCSVILTVGGYGGGKSVFLGLAVSPFLSVIWIGGGKVFLSLYLLSVFAVMCAKFFVWCGFQRFLSDEIKREKEFYRLRDLPYPKDIPALGSEAETERPSTNGVAECDFHRMDEQVLFRVFHVVPCSLIFGIWNVYLLYLCSIAG